MRETRFRGMAVNGCWYFGNLTVLTVKVGQVPPGHYISNAGGLPFAYEVRPETVGQYTGLEDKNDKEIYEGDAIKHEVTQIAYLDKVVTFANGMFLLGKSPLGWPSPKCLEVIGNIIDNPELLPGSESD